MATGNIVSFHDWYGEHKFQAEINLWLTDSDADSAVLHASGGGWLYNSDGWNGSSIDIAGTTESGNCAGGPTDYYWAHSNWWWSDINLGEITKTHAKQTIKRSCTFNYGGKGTSTATASIEVPAKSSYSVTYNAGEGSGAPAAQTKWYGETLKLQTGKPTRSGFKFKGWTGSDGKSYQPGANYTGDAGLTLTAVWQALVTDLEDVADITIGEAPVLAWTPQAAELTYKVRFTLGSWTWTSGVISPSSTSRYVYDDTVIPLTVCEQLPDQTVGLLTVELLTYNGSDLTGTSRKYCNASVPDSAVPVIVSHTIEAANPNALNLYLQRHTMLDVTVDFQGAYGSTITSYAMTVDGITKTQNPSSSPATSRSKVLTTYGELPVTMTITDSRGRTATVTETITVHEYMQPRATIAVEANPERKNVTTTCQIFFSDLGGLNTASYSLNGLPSQECEDGDTVTATVVHMHPYSRNYRSRLVITDRITSSTTVKDLYPGKGNRFDILDEGQYYIGIDEKGWKQSLSIASSIYDGGVKEDGTIWFERTKGHGPVGIGFPVSLEPDTDYELIYSANRADDDTIAFVSFFQQFGDTEDGFRYLSSTYEEGEYLHSGSIFHTPANTAWGIVVLGVDPDYEETMIGYQEFTNVVVRKIEKHEEDLEWELETGNLGLDTPNQKYISRIQLRVEYHGKLKVEIAYDNAPRYTTVHESKSDHMRSITVPINVRRNDHFRLRLSGVGTVKLYSMGYYLEDGSARCLI